MKHISFLMAFIFITMSCSKIMYFSDQLDEEVISKFATYSTIDLCDEQVNPIMALRLKNAIDIRMLNQGKLRSDTPEMKIQFFMKDEQKLYYSNCIDYGSYEGGEYCQTRVIQYEEGSIIIDIIDAKQNEIVWHGAATGPSFNQIKNPNKKISEAVNKLLNQFFDSNPQDKKWNY